MSLNGVTPTDGLTVRQRRALQSVTSAHAALDAAKVRRAEALAKARDKGVPWRLLAEALEMTPEGAAKLMQRGR